MDPCLVLFFFLSLVLVVGGDGDFFSFLLFVSFCFAFWRFWGGGDVVRPPL